jgi:hypothetical protein
MTSQLTALAAAAQLESRRAAADRDRRASHLRPRRWPRISRALALGNSGAISHAKEAAR